jgi:hypothetical protein
MSCENGCYEAVISGCNDIIIRAGFTPNYPLYWIVKKSNSNNIYQKLTQTNTEGELVIDIDNLPSGYLTSKSFLKIKVRDGSNYLQPILFQFGGTNYSGIMAELVNVKRPDSDSSDINVIQFTTATLPANTGITFQADADFTINLKAGETLEYISLDNSSTMNIIVSTTPGGNELADQEVANLQPLVLMHIAASDETIYVKGVLPATIVKFKKS